MIGHEASENIRPRQAIRFGDLWPGKTCIIAEAVIYKVQVYPTPKNVKKVQVFIRIEGWEDFYSLPDKVSSSLIPPGKEGHVWDWGSEQQAIFKKLKNTREANQISGHLLLS